MSQSKVDERDHFEGKFSEANVEDSNQSVHSCNDDGEDSVILKHSRERRMNRIISTSELQKHADDRSCWVVIEGTVYDVTKFASKHPGGKAILMQSAAKDATRQFKVIHGDAVLRDALQRGDVIRVGHYRAAGKETSNGQSKHVVKESGLPVPAAEAVPISDVDASLKHFPSIKRAGVVRRFLDSMLGVGSDASELIAKTVLALGLQPMWDTQKMMFPIRGFPTPTDGSKTRVAIVGGGCSGASAAWCLHQTEGFDFTLFEKKAELGGHSYTFAYDAEKHGGGPPGQPIVNVDMGYIFGNYRSYQNQLEIMALTGVKPIECELSLSVDIDGNKWSTDAHLCPIDGKRDRGHMHPDGRSECDRFHALAERMYDNRALNLLPFGTFLATHGFSEDWKRLYMTPTLITLFISPDGLYKMSTRFMLNMFAGENKYVDLRYAWRCYTIEGGTNKWIRKMVEPFKDRCRTSCGVKRICRASKKTDGKVEIHLENGDIQRFDHVLLAIGAPTAALLLEREEMSYIEKMAFDNIKYATERVVLHTDQSFVPSDPRMKRNFNYVHYPGMREPQLTGLLHEVSRQPKVEPCPILTMNPCREFAPGTVIHERYCSVHVQDLQHMVITRVLIPQIQGVGGIWHCGSWTNWFGHSGGIDAGLATARRIGAHYPLKGDIARKDFHNNACFDMFGPRFDWETSVRAPRPILRAAL